MQVPCTLYENHSSISTSQRQGREGDRSSEGSLVGTAESSTFLSFTFHLKRPTVSRKALTDFKAELKRLTGRSWGISMERRYEEIRTYLQGWMNYFGIGMRYNDAVELDHRLRRRILMCYWKQWGTTRSGSGS